MKRIHEIFSMSVNKYKILCAVVEYGSLTRAAAAMGITQSGVSHTIASLEREIGFSIIKRGHTGVRLTPEGEIIIPAVRGIVNSSEQLEQLAASIHGVAVGNVRIGTFTSVAVHWLPQIMREFQNEYPGINIKIYSGDYSDVDSWLSDGTVDLAFVAPPCSGDYDIIPLSEDRILAILPKDHPMASYERFPVSAFGTEPFISMPESSDHHTRRAIEAAGVVPNVKYSTKDDYAIIAMVENGLGVSVMPELLLSGRNYNVAALELDPPASRTIALAIPSIENASPATKAFANHIKSWVERNR